MSSLLPVVKFLKYDSINQILKNNPGTLYTVFSSDSVQLSGRKLLLIKKKYENKNSSIDILNCFNIRLMFKFRKIKKDERCKIH